MPLAHGSGDAAPDPPWRQVGATWLAGVLAAVALGAVAPVSSEIQTSWGLSFGTVTLATACMTAVGAVLGIPVGWWTSRLCARRALLAGLVVLAVTAGLSALADSWTLLLALRTAEGAGYLLVFVAGPIVLTGLTRGRTRAAALALWGTCVPTGLALAAAAGGALASGLTWRSWLGLTGVGPLLLVGVLAVALPRAEVRRRPAEAYGPGPAGGPEVRGSNVRGSSALSGTGLRAVARFLGPAGAYACLSVIGVAMAVVVPAFLTQVRHEPTATAGAVAAVVTACSALGGLVAGWLLRRGATLTALVPLAALMPLACLPAFSTGLPLGLGVAAAATVLFVDGLLISAVFAAVPALARRAEDIDLANGALAQFGSIGVLTGPPLFGQAVKYAGWGATSAATALFAAAGGGLLLFTARRVARAGPDLASPPEFAPPAPARARTAGDSPPRRTENGSPRGPQHGSHHGEFLGRRPE